MFIVSLLLFLSLVASWVVLPGNTIEPRALDHAEPLPANSVTQAI
jgi:hypothetical protein